MTVAAAIGAGVYALLQFVLLLFCAQRRWWGGAGSDRTQGKPARGGSRVSQLRWREMAGQQQRRVAAGIACLVILTVLRLSTNFGGESVDTVEAVQLRIKAENDMLRAELAALPNDDLLEHVKHKVAPCENMEPKDAGCNQFLTTIYRIRGTDDSGSKLRDRIEAEQALVDLHQYQLSQRTAHAHGARGRTIHRAGPIESAKALTKVLSNIEG